MKKKAPTSDRITELADNLSSASDAYYNGTPSVTDEVYDAWRDELGQLSPDHPVLKAIGAPVASEWVKVRHEIPMGSLDKVQTPEEFALWAAKVGRSPSEKFFYTEKIDGLSVSVFYEDGKLVKALTRGDGQIGEDITSNVRRMKVPQKLKKPMTAVFRGEIVLFKDDHKKHFAGQSNPRNTASGTSKRLDGTGSEHLTILFYQMFPDLGADEGFETESAQFEMIQSLGLPTPLYGVDTSMHSIIVTRKHYEDVVRDKLKYEIDGLVIRLDDLAYQGSWGDHDGRPRGAIAFKFTPPSQETTANTLIWQVGNTGRITPVAVFEPVTLVGAVVERASLYNVRYIREIGFDVGARILVTRANDVIPRVSQVTKSTKTVAKPPTECPDCGATTAMDGEYLICPNVAGCPSQTAGRLKQWINELGILEWGDELLQKVVEHTQVRTIADLYRLTKAELAALPRMGEKSAENVYKTLWGAVPLTLVQFFGALSIPLCATSTIQVIVDAGYNTLDKIRNITSAQLQAIPNVGPKRAESMVIWLSQNRNLIADILSTGVKIKDRVVGPLTGKSVCFTGSSTRKRSELELMVINAGGAVKGAGRELTYLVMADPNSTSSKAQAARKNGTTCISEAEFVALCGE